MHTRTVLYLGAHVDPCIKSIADDTGFTLIAVDTTTNLFSELPKNKLDLIILDFKTIKSVQTSCIFELITTIYTILRCCKKDCPISILMDPSEFVEWKSISTDEIKGVIPKLTGDEYKPDIKEALVDLFNGKQHLPKRFLIKKEEKTVISKGINLTPKEKLIIDLICHRGSSNKSIAKILTISESTVKMHVSSILKKYGVKNRTQLVAFTKDQRSAVAT